ncbi:claudin-9 [Chanos chanos]|uniref:Claudin n=1 Tax=Chanos chanos TaxID=29144 RepID=A0A6J2W084_CHACN|nr:claudin-9-like [Chanos chanos]
MANTGLQVLGLILSITGWVGGALVCAVPWWRVSAFVGNELVVAQVLWEGLWMTCLSEWGRLQCKIYDSGLALSSSAQLSRAMSVIALLICFLAVPVAVTGLKCTRCLGDAQGPKGKLARASGILFVLGGVVFLMPVCWMAYVVVRDFYDPDVPPPNKRELGPALYLGWIVSILMIIGGALLYAGSTNPGALAPPGRGGIRSNPPSTASEGKQEKAFV